MNSIWKATNLELYDIINNNVNKAVNRTDVGDITVVCHTSSQSKLLQRMIDSAKIITDKIIIFDDCSIDDTVDVALSNGCTVYSIPEGWLYTHGFGKLIEYQVKVCDSDYHFQVDTGEMVCVPTWAKKVTGNIVGTLWINNFKDRVWSEDKQIRHHKYNRLLSTKFNVVFPAYIHGAPLGIGNASTTSDLMIVQERDDNKKINSQYYKDRHNRLYNKLLRKGFHDRKLENSFWYDKYANSKEALESVLADAESRIGVLNETSKPIVKIN